MALVGEASGQMEVFPPSGSALRTIAAGLPFRGLMAREKRRAVRQGTFSQNSFCSSNAIEPGSELNRKKPEHSKNRACASADPNHTAGPVFQSCLQQGFVWQQLIHLVGEAQDAVVKSTRGHFLRWPPTEIQTLTQMKTANGSQKSAGENWQSSLKQDNSSNAPDGSVSFLHSWLSYLSNKTRLDGSNLYSLRPDVTSALEKVPHRDVFGLENVTK